MIESPLHKGDAFFDESFGCGAAALKPTRVRHIVLWLTVAAYMITYMDRVVISSAVPVMQKEFGFSFVTMGWILSSFRWGYALFQLPGGWLGDRFGPRRALTWIVTWWSISPR
jgi:MFS family permease